jgi:hypothetical protein
MQRCGCSWKFGLDPHEEQVMRYRAVLVAIWMTAFVLLASAGTKMSQADDSRPNPPYKNWAAFNVGASSTLKSTLIDHSGDDPNTIDATARPEGASEQFSTYKLVQKTPEKVVVEQTDTDIELGSETEHAAAKITYPATLSAKAEKASPKSTVTGLKEGDGKVEVAGKTLKCQWVESVIKIGDETSINKLWWSDSVPGGTIKQVTIKKQGDKVFFERTTMLVDYKTGE